MADISTMNSLNLGLAHTSGSTDESSTFMSMSQKGVTKLIEGLKDGTTAISVIPAAPTDKNKTYGMKAGAWTEVDTTVPAVPSTTDGKYYALCNGAWVDLESIFTLVKK